MGVYERRTSTDRSLATMEGMYVFDATRSLNAGCCALKKQHPGERSSELNLLVRDVWDGEYQCRQNDHALLSLIFSCFLLRSPDNDVSIIHPSW